MKSMDLEGKGSKKFSFDIVVTTALNNVTALLCYRRELLRAEGTAEACRAAEELNKIANILYATLNKEPTALRDALHADVDRLDSIVMEQQSTGSGTDELSPEQSEALRKFLQGN